MLVPKSLVESGISDFGGGGLRPRPTGHVVTNDAPGALAEKGGSRLVPSTDAG